MKNRPTEKIWIRGCVNKIKECLVNEPSANGMSYTYHLRKRGEGFVLASIHLTLHGARWLGMGLASPETWMAAAISGPAKVVNTSTL